MKLHEWLITSSPYGDSVRIVAACPKCGLVRICAAPAVGDETHIDLRGECPGEPQEPEAPRKLAGGRF
jgi:hypothetical protein